MGKALEIVTALATAPSTGAVATACSGNSLTIRDSKKPVWLLDVWRTGQAVGSARITSPFMHDAVVGIHMAAPSGSQILLRSQKMRLQNQDTLTVTLEGSATAGDIEHLSFLVYYEDLPGISGRFMSHKDLERKMIDIYASENNISTGTDGCYSGEETVTVEQDQMKANTDYALLGATFQVPGHAVRWRSPDWGNLGLGMPSVIAAGWHNSFYFKDLSERYNLPLIPIINSSNKDLLLIDAVADENGTDMVVSTVMGRLK